MYMYSTCTSKHLNVSLSTYMYTCTITVQCTCTCICNSVQRVLILQQIATLTLETYYLKCCPNDHDTLTMGQQR